jgi:phosphoglycerol transferase
MSIIKNINSINIKKYFSYQCGLSFIGISLWLTKHFGTVTLDQLIYHLDFGGDALISIDEILVYSFLKSVILAPAILALICSVFDSYISRTITVMLIKNTALKMPPHNFLIRLFQRLAIRRGFLVIIGGIWFFLQSVSAFAFIIQEQFSKDYFSDNYTYPSDVTVKPLKPKNLVLIYVESFEASYADPAYFGKNLVKSLTDLHGNTFDKFTQVPGTGWTMAGIVSSQCGMPLKNIFGGLDHDTENAHTWLNKLGKNMNSYLPNAICLGDILHSNGYRNVFIGGAAGSFAGKETFFRTHHYDEYYGKDELADLGATLEEGVGWGYLNDQTLDISRKSLKKLHDSGQRFNLTILTLDTHGPDGLYSPDCRKRGANNYNGIVSCTSDQLAEFISFMSQQGYLEDTNVIIIGDHLSMKTPISDRLPESQKRSIFNKFVSDDKPIFNRNEIVHFDLFPTILEFIGFDVEGDRLGFGFSALNDLSSDFPSDRIEKLRENILNRSDIYLGFWR